MGTNDFIPGLVTLCCESPAVNRLPIDTQSSLCGRNLNLHRFSRDERFVEGMHQNGAILGVYSVNTSKKMSRMHQNGATIGIFSKSLKISSSESRRLNHGIWVVICRKRTHHDFNDGSNFGPSQLAVDTTTYCDDFGVRQKLRLNFRPNWLSVRVSRGTAVHEILELFHLLVQPSTQFFIRNSGISHPLN